MGSKMKQIISNLPFNKILREYPDIDGKKIKDELAIDNFRKSFFVGWIVLILQVVFLIGNIVDHLYDEENTFLILIAQIVLIVFSLVLIILSLNLL